MRKAVVMALVTTLILSASYTRAQVGVSVGPVLILVKGDIPNASTPSCSFISATELGPVPIVSRLLSVLLGDSPEEVATEIGFPPDRPDARGIMRWTSELEGQYIRAEVQFRNQRVISRTVTMATNYQQPNQRQCLWEVRALQDQLQPGVNPASSSLGSYR